MKIQIGSALCLGLLLSSGSAFAAKPGKACAISDVAKLKEHFEKHVTYPAKGKAIKEACKKELPDEFPKSEKSCIAKKLKNNVEYKDAAEVLQAIGVEAAPMQTVPAQ